ncbi:hypothetical protein M2437_004984 [Methylorubrum pseudosasae]|nr:hypothetical protein [Methylorubrum pseudosasae]
MRADRARAVREGAGEAEGHAAAQILRVPVAGAVHRRGVAGSGKVAGRIGRAGDGVALVEMGVGIDEARPDLPPGEIRGGQRIRQGVRRPPGRQETGDDAVRNDDVEERAAIPVEDRAGRYAAR